MANNRPIVHEGRSKPERPTRSRPDMRARSSSRPASPPGTALHTLTVLVHIRLIADVESHRDPAIDVLAERLNSTRRSVQVPARRPTKLRAALAAPGLGVDEHQE